MRDAGRRTALYTLGFVEHSFEVRDASLRQIFAALLSAPAQ
jgi:hypothetical protein